MQKKIYIRYVIILICVVIAGLGYVISRSRAKEDVWDWNTETAPSPQVFAETGDDFSALTETDSEIYVHVCGAVVYPGVYPGVSGDRVYQFIQKAGGIREDGTDIGLNLARIVSDGEQIYVFDKEEASKAEASAPNVQPPEPNSTVSDKVNLNTASETELTTLPGIGPAKAKAIIAYREKHGLFQSIEELMNIQGIKGATFEQIKGLISV